MQLGGIRRAVREKDGECSLDMLSYDAAETPSKWGCPLSITFGSRFISFHFSKNTFSGVGGRRTTEGS